jgi:hypothetical protein
MHNLVRSWGVGGSNPTFAARTWGADLQSAKRRIGFATFCHRSWKTAQQFDASCGAATRNAEESGDSPFFGSLKKERIKKQIYKNRKLATADVANYIETFYNRTRRHSHLGGLSPEQFEAVHKPHRRGLH